MTPKEFSDLRYGMFVHFGLFSLLERGEWVMNRERISPDKMREYAKNFHPDKFNADEICDLAVAGGMKYGSSSVCEKVGIAGTPVPSSQNPA